MSRSISNRLRALQNISVSITRFSLSPVSGRPIVARQGADGACDRRVSAGKVKKRSNSAAAGLRVACEALQSESDMLPRQIDIEIPLLTALKKLGGKAKPQDIYAEVTKSFPNLMPADLSEQLQSGGNRWKNRIQWVRQALVARGELSNAAHGVWEITHKGLARLKLEASASPAASTNASSKTTSSNGAIPVFGPLINLEEVSEDYAASFKANVLQKLHDLTPAQFEHFASFLLKAYGFQKISVTGKSGDGGIDGNGQLIVGMAILKAAFQCKRWDNPVGPKEVQAFRGAIQGQFEQGYFFATSTFTKAAQAESIKMGAAPIILFGGTQIVDIMIERGVGIKRRPIEIYEDQLEALFEAQ
jgi:restriction system protein